MSSVRRYLELPEGLNQPTLFAAFDGWNDAGEAATGALEALSDVFGARRFADLDPEEFFDFQVSRPIVRWDNDVRMLEWPSNVFSYARLDGPRDVIMLLGREPNMRWRTFTEAILDLARGLGVTRIVTIGALQVDVPHTRAVPLTGSSTDVEVAEAHGLRRSNYEGPTGIVGVLHQAAADAGFEAVTLWVGVPHYLSGTAYQKASLAIAERALRLLEVEADLGELAQEAEAQLADIAELVDEDHELAEYVTELEDRADLEPHTLSTDQLPTPPVSGDQLAADFERYLQNRRED
ncbi:MAG TPA: PAC2 family protein [Euzebya sp.]|nr:PAC2 family protein [Euzebya sp.]